MVKAKDAIRVARSLIGTPYSELDCINLIKKVIRTAPGGVKGYTTATTVSLWDSYAMTPKYRDLTWRQENIDGALAGMLAFKRYSKSADHVGIVTGDGTVVHSSSVHGQVVETPLTIKEGWNGLGIHRHISTTDDVIIEEELVETETWYGKVVLSNPDNPDNYLNVRNEPSTRGDVIAKLHHDAPVVIMAKPTKGWLFIQFGDNGSGYVSEKYVIETDPPEPEVPPITIVDSEGNTFCPVGDWRVLIGSID